MWTSFLASSIQTVYDGIKQGVDCFYSNRESSNVGSFARFCPLSDSAVKAVKSRSIGRKQYATDGVTSVLECRFRPARWILESSSLDQPRGIDAAAFGPRSCGGFLIWANQGYENGPRFSCI